MEKLSTKDLQALRKKSKGWGQDEWENYLQTLEVNCSESLLCADAYSILKENYYSLGEKTTPPLQSEQLKNALNDLTFKQRQVLEMVFWDGLSERSIAKKIGVSREAIKDRKRKALQKLRRILRAQ